MDESPEATQLSESEAREKLKIILEAIDEDDDGIVEGDELIEWMAEAEK